MGSRGCPEERQILVLGGEQEEGTFLLQPHPLGPQQHKVPPRASWLCHPKTCKLQPHGGATANGEQTSAVSRCHNLTWMMGREESLSKVSSKNSSHLLLKLTAVKGVACGGSFLTSTRTRSLSLTGMGGVPEHQGQASGLLNLETHVLPLLPNSLQHSHRG